jgi:hypothetical protein
MTTFFGELESPRLQAEASKARLRVQRGQGVSWNLRWSNEAGAVGA